MSTRRLIKSLAQPVKSALTIRSSLIIVFGISAAGCLFQLPASIQPNYSGVAKQSMNAVFADKGKDLYTSILPREQKAMQLSVSSVAHTLKCATPAKLEQNP